ncbi:MAG: acyl-CoA dehydrogenase family protein, partial [Bacteroidota bacterium]
GGMGYSEETLAARAYRDSRIAMIYEGTNEINRMLMLNLIFKRAMSGKFDFATKAMQVQQELLTGNNGSFTYDSIEEKAVTGFKKIALMLIGSVGQLAMKGKIDLKQEQEILLNLADILIDTYLAESTVLRNVKANTPYSIAITKTFLRGASERIRQAASEAIGSFVKPELQEGYIAGVHKFLTYPLVNVKEHKRNIADNVISAKAYVS